MSRPAPIESPTHDTHPVQPVVARPAGHGAVATPRTAPTGALTEPGDRVASPLERGIVRQLRAPVAAVEDGALHAGETAASAPVAVVDAARSEAPPVNLDASRDGLSAQEWRHVRIVSEALYDACGEDPDGQAGVARRLGKSKQFLRRCCDSTDAQTLSTRYIGLLPHAVRRVYLRLIDQAYRREAALPDVRPDHAASELVMGAATALRRIQQALEDGAVQADELRETEEALNAVDRVSAQCRGLMRQAAGKGA